MDWVENVELYLRLKLSANPSRHSFGVKFLSQFPDVEEKFKVFALITHQIISKQSETINGETYCRLTNCSISIGSRIVSTLTNPRFHDWRDQVRIGDLMIETFYQLGYVDVVTPPHKSSKPVKVVVLEGFPMGLPKEVERMSLHGIWGSRPKDINRAEQIIQLTKSDPKFIRPIIKRWDEKLDGLFSNIVNTKAISALNKLQQVGWKVDKDTLDAVLSNPNLFYSETSNTVENLSKKIDYKYTMVKAKCLSELNEFFFALDMDYRGRIYYVESYMNFQGSDLARGILRFSEKRIVSPEGLRWIKIHCASSFNESFSKGSIPEWCTSDYKAHLDSEGLDDISVDKMTLRDRELWCDNNMEKIHETAVNKKLHDCEKPVSFLSAAIEIYNYYNSDGYYYSDLPIPVDGSNNGWQHLGAISKDVQTGELVGLVPVGIQNDFYVQTAKKMIEITKDAERKEILSKMPMKKIRKGISKRGSMTRAYSAGAQKIAENMYIDCKTAGYVEEYGITEAHCKGFSRDLVKAIELVCPGPLKTMKFLQKLAVERLNQGYNYITWVTPSGFPVVYTCYHKYSERQRGSIQGIGQIKHVAKTESMKPDLRGYMCGISPNFIHSQDASHMSLVIDEFNGPFGAVHDSFSTHASDVDNLLSITKRCFIEMYDNPNYFDVMEGKIGSTHEQPALGDLEINDINDSDYFFA
jgi:hypothetical protein